MRCMGPSSERWGRMDERMDVAISSGRPFGVGMSREGMKDALRMIGLVLLLHR